MNHIKGGIFTCWNVKCNDITKEKANEKKWDAKMDECDTDLSNMCTFLFYQL